MLSAQFGSLLIMLVTNDGLIKCSIYKVAKMLSSLVLMRVFDASLTAQHLMFDLLAAECSLF